MNKNEIIVFIKTFALQFVIGLISLFGALVYGYILYNFGIDIGADELTGGAIIAEFIYNLAVAIVIMYFSGRFILKESRVKKVNPMKIVNIFIWLQLMLLALGVANLIYISKIDTSGIVDNNLLISTVFEGLAIAIITIITLRNVVKNNGRFNFKKLV
jgi:hypothetical protein